MAIEYAVERLGYEMSDNVIKRCREKLDKVVRKNISEDEILKRAKKIINRA